MRLPVSAHGSVYGRLLVGLLGMHAVHAVRADAATLTVSPAQPGLGARAGWAPPAQHQDTPR